MLGTTPNINLTCYRDPSCRFSATSAENKPRGSIRACVLGSKSTRYGAVSYGSSAPVDWPVADGRSTFHCGRSMPRAHHWQLDPNFRTHPSGSRHGRFVPAADMSVDCNVSRPAKKRRGFHALSAQQQQMATLQFSGGPSMPPRFRRCLLKIAQRGLRIKIGRPSWAARSVIDRGSPGVIGPGRVCPSV